jgi:hypothetical protein
LGDPTAPADSRRKRRPCLGLLRDCRTTSDEARNDPGHEANSSPRQNKTYGRDRRIKKIPEQGGRPGRPHYGSPIVHLEPSDFALLIHPELLNASGMTLYFNVGISGLVPLPLLDKVTKAWDLCLSISTSDLVLSYGLRDALNYGKIPERVELSLNLPMIRKIREEQCERHERSYRRARNTNCQADSSHSLPKVHMLDGCVCKSSAGRLRS